MTAQERMAGGSGTYGIAVTTKITRAFEVIQVNADTVISELTYATGTPAVYGTNALTFQSLGTTTWGAGMIITAPMGVSFKSITLTSGSVTIS